MKKGKKGKNEKRKTPLAGKKKKKKAQSETTWEKNRPHGSGYETGLMKKGELNFCKGK